MRNGLLGSLAALAAGAGLAFSQTPGQSVLPSGPSAFASAMPQGPAGPVEPLGTPPPLAGPNYNPGPALNMVGPSGYGDPGYGAPGDFDGNARAIECGWVELEYLLWAVRNGPSNFPLIMTGTIPGGAVPGVPGSTLVFGGTPFDWNLFSGARVTAGRLLPGSSRVGVMSTGLILPRKSVQAAAASGPLGIPVVGRPFINQLTGTIQSLNAGSPGNPGLIEGRANTMMWTAEIDLYANLYNSDYLSVRGISGFKHFNLAEGIMVRSQRTIGTAGQTFLGRPLPIGATTLLEDRFDTTNRFYGWQLGFDFEYRYRCWVLNAGFHSAIGVMRRSVDNSSLSRATVGPVSQGVPGGLLSGLTNLGRRNSNEFAVIPEARGEIGYQITKSTRFAIGYSGMWTNTVARPGAQIDPVVNPTLVPLHPQFAQALGTARPFQLFQRSDYWAQGVNWSLTTMY